MKLKRKTLHHGIIIYCIFSLHYPRGLYNRWQRKKIAFIHPKNSALKTTILLDEIKIMIMILWGAFGHDKDEERLSLHCLKLVPSVTWFLMHRVFTTYQLHFPYVFESFSCLDTTLSYTSSEAFRHKNIFNNMI